MSLMVGIDLVKEVLPVVDFLKLRHGAQHARDILMRRVARLRRKDSMETINLCSDSDDDETPENIPAAAAPSVPTVIDLTLDDEDEDEPQPQPTRSRRQPEAARSPYVPLFAPEPSPSPPPPPVDTTNNEIDNSLASPRNSAPPSDHESDVLPRVRRKRSLNSPDDGFASYVDQYNRRGSTQVNAATNNAAQGPRRDTMVPLTQPAFVRRRVKAMEKLNQPTKGSSTAPKLTTATNASRKKVDKPTKPRQNLVNKVVTASLDSLVPSVATATPRVRPRAPATPPSIPAGDISDNIDDAPLDVVDSILQGSPVTSPNLQRDVSTISFDSIEPLPYDPEEASRGAGSSRNAEWYTALRPAGWRSRAGQTVVSTDDLGDKRKGKRKREITPDDPPEEMAKKQRIEREEDESDLSIHLDNLLGVIQPKKVDKVVGKGSASDDSPLEEAILPSLQPTEDEYDELGNEDVDIREITSFDAETGDAIEFLFEAQDIPVGQELSPQRPSFMADDEDARMESPEKPFVLSADDIVSEPHPWTHVLEGRGRESTVERSPVHRGQRSESLVEQELEDTRMDTPTEPKQADSQPRSFADPYERDLKAILDDFSDVISLCPDFTGGYHRPGISPNNAPWQILRPYLRRKLELERGKLEAEGKLPRQE